MQRAKELEASLEENLSDEARNVLQKQVEDFDDRWEDLSEKMDQAVKENETAVSTHLCFFGGVGVGWWVASPSSTSRKNNLELIELSSINKVSLV